MRIRGSLPLMAIITAAAIAGTANMALATTPHHGAKISVSHVGWGHSTLHYAPQGARPGHLVSLVGDRESGLGFYPLPRQYRAAGTPDGRGDAIRYAVASEAGYGYFGDGQVYGDRHHHGIFNPVDGYGTPFFAGYYGPAGDPDDDRGPFGRPYTN